MKTPFGYRALLVWLSVAGALGRAAPAVAQGRIVVDTLHARALERNSIGDSAERRVTVYLPPSYDLDHTRRYPVVYLLHGATSEPEEWLDGTYQGLDLRAALDARAGEGEYIVVMPSANNRVGGSFYVNSRAFGRWEEVITNDLVRHIDARYRTQPEPLRRMLAGASMGGFGALYLAGRHADTFAHVYAMSPCCLAFMGDLAADGARWQGPPRTWLQAMATALAPAPRRGAAAPGAPMPFVLGPDGRLREVPAVARRWRTFMPLYRLKRAPTGYRRLCTIGLEAGRQDEITNVSVGAAAFSRDLTRARIPHRLDEFTGGHVDRTRERFETAVLPHVARVFAAQEGHTTCVRP